jgi:carbon monoxide dehydrogenase subunit G
MEFENTFLVQAPVETVWDLLLDVERIAPCMPGAKVLEQTGEDAYKVAVKVRLGPMTMNYTGDVEILEKDAASHQARMRAKAKEARGQGTAQADIRMALQEQDGGTSASIVTEMQMSGKAAAMGQGVVRDVAASLTDTFAQNLAGMVEAAQRPAAPVAPAPAAPGPEVTADGPQAAAAPEPAPPPPSAQSAPESALPASKIIISVVSGRLREPRGAAVLAVATFLLGLALGRRRGR